MFSLTGKVAVITGGASGMGKSAAQRFSKAGALVVVADITDGSAVAKEVGGVFIKTNVAVENEVKTLMEAAVSKFGRLDIVINNAGIGLSGFIPDITDEILNRHLAINLKGVLWGIKHSAPLIADGGSIINTASSAGLTGAPSHGAYVASKFAVVGITKTAALELAPRRVRVNCVCPGTIDTPLAHTEGAETELKLSSLLMPLGRLGTPEEIAALYHFLASDESAFITGTAIPIDGGMSAGPGLNMVGALYQVVAGEALDLQCQPK